MHDHRRRADDSLLAVDSPPDAVITQFCIFGNDVIHDYKGSASPVDDAPRNPPIVDYWL